jgi:hypothetical protein
VAILDELIANAVAIATASRASGEGDDMWPALEPARGMGRPLFDSGVRLLSGGLAEQEVGCLLLRMSCVDHDDWRPAATLHVLSIAPDTTDADVCDAIAGALGELAQSASIPTLVELCRHEDADVRVTAASSLAACSGPDYHGSPLVVETLLGLMRDPYDDVRNWATFALGVQLRADSAEIRDLLAERLTDSHAETSQEALLGLARRRDPRALAATAAALQEDEIFERTIEAAEWLADTSLHSRLAELQDRWDPGALGIDDAIGACDPAARERDVAAMTDLLRQLTEALSAEGLDLVPSLRSNLGQLDVQLTIAQRRPAEPPSDKVWGFHRLMVRAGNGGVARAAALAVGDLDLSV